MHGFNLNSFINSHSENKKNIKYNNVSYVFSPII